MATDESAHKDGAASAPAAVTASDARNRMGDLLDRTLGGERIKIQRHGKTVAVLVPAADLAVLTAA